MRLSSIEVKRLNRISILKYILNAEAVSKNSIALDTRLSLPTVTQGLRDLENVGLVREEGVLESIGGRKAMSYRCVKDAKAALGIDITGNHINIVIINMAKQILYSKRVKIRLHDDPASYGELKEVIQHVLDESGIHTDKMLGLGISLPAIIDETGTKVYAMHEQLNLSFNLYDIVKHWFPFPVIIENDANSAGKAELAFSKSNQNTVYLFVSQSVGGAIIINGQVYYGKMRRGGEFGHMTLFPGGKLCYCGRKGCINSYCSTKNLSDLAGDDLQQFFEGLEQKEETYVEVWNEYLDNLALAIHNLNMAFDSEIIIGGYLGQYIGPYMDSLRERVQKIDSYLSGDSFIKPAMLKYEASAIGVAAGFIDKYIDEI